MGSSSSKHKAVKQKSRPTSPEPGGKKSRSKAKRSRKSGDAASIASSTGDESRRSSVSYIPNGDVKLPSDTKVNGSTLRVDPFPNGHVRSASNVTDVSQVTVRTDKTPNGTLTKTRGSRHDVTKEENNNTKLTLDDVDSATLTKRPDNDYNGGSALPKSASSQNLFSRLKNGIGNSKKSSLQLVWEATRDDSRKKLSQLCDVAFLSSSVLAVSRHDAGRPGLQLYNLEDGGRAGPLLGENFLKAPRGICVSADMSNIAVTDWEDKTVKFMDANGGFIGAWKTNKFQHPGGIAINREGRYIVADITRKEAALGLYSPYGKLFRRFGAENFDWPWYVTVDRKNRILVSERKNSIINVFDEDGRFLFKFGGSETTGSSGRSPRGEDIFNSPGGLAVDSQNNILVVDSDNYRTSMFSPDGIFIKTLVTTTFNRPVSVAYDDGMVAMVTDNDLRLYRTYMEKTSF